MEGFKRVYRIEAFRVVDGDTIEATIDLGFYVKTKQYVRLKNVDTFELRDPNPKLRKLADIEKKELAECMINCDRVMVETEKTGKYGRWIGVLLGYREKGFTNINKHMVEFHQNLIQEASTYIGQMK